MEYISFNEVDNILFESINNDNAKLIRRIREDIKNLQREKLDVSIDKVTYNYLTKLFKTKPIHEFRSELFASAPNIRLFDVWVLSSAIDFGYSYEQYVKEVECTVKRKEK